MPIEISTQLIHASYASIINKIQPNANIYDNPNQQGTELPAWFIVHRSPIEIRKEAGKIGRGSRFEATISIDLWYLLKQNITRLFDQYTAIAEKLDENLEYLPILNTDAVLHVHDRTWSLELNALKYSTTLRFKIYSDGANSLIPLSEKMSVFTGPEMFIKNSTQSLVTFTNEDHPQFDAEFPTSILIKTNKRIVLPVVTGEFEDENYIWTPSSWSIGAFGESYRVDENITTNLLWEYRDKPKPDDGDDNEQENNQG